jgi:sulfur relay (sulfurtransferase) DsrF/TusC family protein
VKKALILIRTAPYGEASPAEGFRVVMTLPSMGMETTALVMEDGVFCLVRDADATRVGWRGNLADAFAQTREFDARLLVHEPSMNARGLAESEIIAHDGAVDDETVKALIDGADVVLAF